MRTGYAPGCIGPIGSADSGARWRGAQKSEALTTWGEWSGFRMPSTYSRRIRSLRAVSWRTSDQEPPCRPG